jgi:hypothetical protein
VARQAAQKKTEDAYATWTQECAAAPTLSTATSPMKHIPKALRPAFLSDPAIIDAIVRAIAPQARAHGRDRAGWRR